MIISTNIITISNIMPSTNCIVLAADIIVKAISAVKEAKTILSTPISIFINIFIVLTNYLLL